ncbi:MAG: hypothetical protein R3190_17805, partial [Thermoanaerobaculia bacterium]|nr:hypothetical protein [Thermoanaerobaculia bacterium]
EHNVFVPQSRLRSGLNVVRFRFAHTASPADVIEGSADARRLSAAFDFVELQPIRLPPAAGATADAAAATGDTE